MNKKMWFLTKFSLKKKIKTKWFLIANLLFLLIIVGLVNVDYIIKLFGGDFNETANIMIIDNANVFSEFKNNYLMASKYVNDYGDVDITLYNGSYNEGIKEVEEEKHKILLVIDQDNDNYLKAKVVSQESLGTITTTLLNTTLSTVRSGLVLTEYNITREQFNNIQGSVELEKVVLEESNLEDNMMVSTIMQIITLPLFMLIMFLIQMIGAEVNEEKSTKSMEIILSNVSPKTHFMSKVIAANGFVLMQGLLLVIYVVIAVIIRFALTGGDILNGVDSEILSLIDALPVGSIMDTLGVLIPILIVMLILTFIAYSLLAGILASMTTNLEDFQQLQTPIVVISLVGYYLAMMAGMFKGSIFIKIMGYIPLISSMLMPTLFVMGEFTIVDLCISILLLLAIIYVLVKYGLRIYKVGILNYSGSGLWKKMFKAIKEK